jgi:hypothetical protein
MYSFLMLAAFEISEMDESHSTKTKVRKKGLPVMVSGEKKEGQPLWSPFLKYHKPGTYLMKIFCVIFRSPF